MPDGLCGTFPVSAFGKQGVTDSKSREQLAMPQMVSLDFAAAAGLPQKWN